MPAPLRDVPGEAIELIKSFEGIPDGDPSTVNLDAYLDPIGIWTIGWGHAMRAPDGKDWLRDAANKSVARGMYPGGITKPQAETLLHADLLDTARDVLRLVKVPLNDSQLGGLLGFVFNLGAGSLASSTLLRLLNGGDYAGAAEQFLVWNKAKVKGVLTPMAGLTRRRTAERALFAGEDWRAASGARGAAPAVKKAAKKAAKKAVKEAAKKASKKAAKTATKTAPKKLAEPPVSAKVSQAATKAPKAASAERGAAAAKKSPTGRAAAKGSVADNAPSTQTRSSRAPAKKSAARVAVTDTSTARKSAAKKKPRDTES